VRGGTTLAMRGNLLPYWQRGWTWQGRLHYGLPTPPPLPKAVAIPLPVPVPDAEPRPVLDCRDWIDAARPDLEHQLCMEVSGLPAAQ
jgi:hypothetical protein